MGPSTAGALHPPLRTTYSCRMTKSNSLVVLNGASVRERNEGSMGPSATPQDDMGVGPSATPQDDMGVGPSATPQDDMGSVWQGHESARYSVLMLEKCEERLSESGVREVIWQAKTRGSSAKP